MKSFVQSFLGSVGRLAGLVVVFAVWLRADLFRAFTLIATVVAIVAFPVDRVASFLVILIWMTIAILAKVKGTWRQIVLSEALLASLFAIAVLKGGIPAIHDPVSALLIGVAVIGGTTLVLCWTFTDTRKPTDPAQPDNYCSGE